VRIRDGDNLTVFPFDQPQFSVVATCHQQGRVGMTTRSTDSLPMLYDQSVAAGLDVKYAPEAVSPAAKQKAPILAKSQAFDIAGVSATRNLSRFGDDNARNAIRPSSGQFRSSGTGRHTVHSFVMQVEKCFQPWLTADPLPHTQATVV
jgi:hypothetical protein